MRRPLIAMAVGLVAVLFWAALASPTTSASPHISGAIFTTLEDGTRVNANVYEDKRDVYLDGGPGPNAPRTAAGLPDGNYYFQVTDPSGKTLLSSDPVLCREFRVEGGIIVEYVSADRTYTKGSKVYDCARDGKQNGQHDTGYDVDHGALTIQLMPYDTTPNKGGVYKAWATPVGQFVGDPGKVDNPCGTGCFHGFVPASSKTDNFKVQKGGKPFENPIITVRKFVDTDGDGVWDAGEPDVGTTYLIDGGGWPVSVADPNEITSNGFTPYQYLPGFAGTYVVTEGLPSGWAQTAAYLDGVAQLVSVDVTVNVAFTSGEKHEVVYGNFECFTVSGRKVNDLNGNGVLNDGEPGIAAWTIHLFRNGGTEPYATTQTDANGDYSFEVCLGGAYEVREATPAGWTPMGPASFFFTAASGVDHAGLDFYNFECFTVSGYKFGDTDGDGTWDVGDPGLAGWTIQLWKGTTLIAEVTTDASGYYSFEVCVPGEYTVKEVQQDGWIATAPASHTFTASSGADQVFDFLNFKLGEICGAKFYDLDHDGAWDRGEPTIPGWKVELYKDGFYQATGTTDAFGEYCFSGLGPGVYEVREVMPNNPDATHVWAQTYPGGDGDWDATVTSGFAQDDADFGNVCEFTESRTWGYWKTHAGFDVLVIDEDSIDNGLPPNYFSDVDVNDDIAAIGLREHLQYFSENPGAEITLYTGQIGDEGWFAIQTVPDSWYDAGPTDDGLKNYWLAGPGLGSPDSNGDRESLLNPVPNVLPLRAKHLEALVGRTVCAVVYDSDVSVNYNPLVGNLKGANLGVVAFEVLDVYPRADGSSSSLPAVDIEIEGLSACFTGPDRDPAYDDLPAHPMPVDVLTPDGDYEIDSDREASWLFGGGAGAINCSGDCVTLFRAQLLALHMNLLKFGADMAEAIYVFAGDSYSGMTVQEVYDAAIDALLDPNYGDYVAFQETLDRINNNHNQSTGSHVLVCPSPPTPEYP